MSSGSVTHWIDLFRQGDEEAALQLWNRYFASLVGTARARLSRMAPSVVDAEDIALSAFHTLYRAASANRLPDLQDREGLWRTLVLITAGKACDAQRRELSLKRGGSATQTPVHLIELVQESEADPQIAAAVSEQFEVLLHQLGDRELQEIAILKLEGYTNEEIGVRLHCSERTVKRRMTVIRRIWEECGMSPSD